MFIRSGPFAKARVGEKTAVMVLAVLSVAGCGGSGTKTATVDQKQSSAPGVTAQSTDSTKAAFIGQGDALCARFRAAVRPLARNTGSLAEVTALLDRAIPLAEGTAAKFRALTPPPGDEARIGTYLDTVQQEVGLLKKARRDASNGSPAAVSSDFGEVKLLAAKAKGIARGYGFHICGSG